MSLAAVTELGRGSCRSSPLEGPLDCLRVAIVHYWLVGIGGGENILEVLGGVFPQADFYVPVVSKRAIPPGLRGRIVKTSFVTRIPGATRWQRHFLPLYPYALEQFDLSKYDLVISSESGPAKGVITGLRTCHICYCLSPMRYLWDMYHDYRKAMNPLTRAVFSLTAHYVRQWDLSTAARVDQFAAISRYVASRIRKYYRRDSAVIHPPVDVAGGYISSKIEDYYLIVSRFVPYKRIDLAIEACNRLGRRLRIVGAGPEYRRLKSIAGPTVEFIGQLDQHSLRENYARCRALLFPAEEDFGIVPVEAQAFGRPVIAYGRGGALETVLGLSCGEEKDASRSTGVFFDVQSPDSLSQAMIRFEAVESRFRPEAVRAWAERFGPERFRAEFTNFVVQSLAEFNGVLSMNSAARSQT